MAKRKPLPYAAASLVDDALMELADAIRALRPIIDGKELSPEEKMRRLAQTVDHIYRSTEALREARLSNTNGG